jgi:hypothetical protein
MRNRSLFFSIVLLAGASGVAQAQIVRQIESDNTAYGTTAAEFLTFAPTARGLALGNSFSALATDVSALHFNPAGLAQMTRPELNASSTTYLVDTKYNWIGIGLPFGGGSRAIGFSLGSYGFGDQPVYTVEDPTGSSGEVYSVAETYLGVTYSQQFSDRFAAGFTMKYINDRLGGVTGRAFALDLGTSFHANIGSRPIRAAFTIQNLGTTLKHSGNALNALVHRNPPLDQQDIPQEDAAAQLRTKEWQLPIQFRVALAYDVFATSASRLSLMGEFTQPNNNDPGFGFAGEYHVSLGTSGFSLAPRMSYTYQPANNLDPLAAGATGSAGFNSTLTAGADGLALGGGIKYQKNPRGLGFGVDYAYRNYGLLGNINVVSFGLTW